MYRLAIHCHTWSIGLDELGRFVQRESSDVLAGHIEQFAEDVA